MHYELFCYAANAWWGRHIVTTSMQSILGSLRLVHSQEGVQAKAAATAPPKAMTTVLWVRWQAACYWGVLCVFCISRGTQTHACGTAAMNDWMWFCWAVVLDRNRVLCHYVGVLALVANPCLRVLT